MSPYRPVETTGDRRNEMELNELLTYAEQEANPFYRPQATREMPYDNGVRQIARNMNQGWKDWRKAN